MRYGLVAVNGIILKPGLQVKGTADGAPGYRIVAAGLNALCYL